MQHAVENACGAGKWQCCFSSQERKQFLFHFLRLSHILHLSFVMDNLDLSGSFLTLFFAFRLNEKKDGVCICVFCQDSVSQPVCRKLLPDVPPKHFVHLLKQFFCRIFCSLSGFPNFLSFNCVANQKRLRTIVLARRRETKYLTFICKTFSSIFGTRQDKSQGFIFWTKNLFSYSSEISLFSLVLGPDPVFRFQHHGLCLPHLNI